MRVALLVILAALTVLSAPSPAAAGGVRVFVGVGTSPIAHQPVPPLSRGFVNPSLRTPTVIITPGPIVAPFGSTIIVSPGTVVPQRVVIFPPPVFFASPVIVVARRCTRPGYWNYYWVSQQYPYNDWVPGRFSDDGYWIDAHYEPRFYGSGYWQPYWVDGTSYDC